MNNHCCWTIPVRTTQVQGVKCLQVERTQLDKAFPREKNVKRVCNHFNGEVSSWMCYVTQSMSSFCDSVVIRRCVKQDCEMMIILVDISRIIPYLFNPRLPFPFISSAVSISLHSVLSFFCSLHLYPPCLRDAMLFCFLLVIVSVAASLFYQSSALCAPFPNSCSLHGLTGFQSLLSLFIIYIFICHNGLKWTTHIDRL